jgi:hypothetical protein
MITSRWKLMFCLTALLIGGAAVAVRGPLVADDAAAVLVATPPIVPIETDMHEFMEYAFQEPYKRLQTGLAAAPADRAAWKIIKSDALLLAESGNLLLTRGPTENRAAWDAHAVQVRDIGGTLYAAGKARDYDAARASWVTLIESCNACHNTFADGEHQLEP